jgi:endonuclease YncB( thermonuclease family)
MHRLTISIALVLAETCAWALAPNVSGVPRIVDGDTVVIGATRIRLQGVDTPETDQLCLNSRGERWTCGIEARDQLRQKAGDKRWQCQVNGIDRDGRSLATCEVDGENINRWLVRSGWALSFIRYSHAYDADEQRARSAKAGLWAGAFMAPWEWRDRNAKTVIRGALSVPINAQAILLSPASAAEAPSPECTIKGNISRRGRIYHLPRTRSYASVKMDISKGKRWFSYAEKREVLDDLVANGSGADHCNLGLRKSLLRKPVDETVPMVPSLHHEPSFNFS